jgi:imidazolonepropionase-like amidohydrolase
MRRYSIVNVRDVFSNGRTVSINVEDGLIASVGAPLFEERIDGRGGWLMPGLFEIHGHFFTPLPKRGYVDNFALSMKLYPANGVTTVCSKGETDEQKAFDTRAAVERGEQCGPHILTPGNWLSRAPAFLPSIISPETEQDLMQAYESRRGQRQLVKIYTNMTADWLSTLCAASHADGLKVYGHIDAMTADQAIDAGIDGLEHGVYFMPEFRAETADERLPKSMLRRYGAFDPNSDTAKRLAEKLVRNSVALIPTVSTVETIASARMARYWEEKDVWSYYSEDIRAAVRGEWLSRRADMPAAQSFVDDMLDRQREFMCRFYRMGGRIYAGTDPSVTPIFGGVSMAREAMHLESFGMCRRDVLFAMTEGAAKEMGVFDRTGSLEKGKQADFILLASDPLDDLSALENVRLTVIGGRIYDPDMLRSQVKGMIK